MTFGIGHPPTYTSIAVYMCGEGSRVPNLQTEFNYLNSFKSYGIFSDFVVPVVPTLSPCHSRHPHIIPVSSPHHPHSPQKVPMSSPWLWSPLSPWSPPMLSPWSPCCPRCPHIVPIIPVSSPSSPCCPHSPQKVPMWSPCLWSPLFPWSPLSPWSPSHVVPVVPMSSLSSPSSPHHLEGPYIIPNPPDTNSTHPPPPGRWGALNQ